MALTHIVSPLAVFFIGIAPLSSTACHFVTLGIMANYHVTMIISSIVFDL